MMTKRTIGALGAALILAAGATAVIAQKPDHTPDPQRQEARKELMTKMQAFAKSDILPEMTRWKSQLDQAMSPADLQKLNGLRARAAALKQQMITSGMGMAKAWKGEDYDALKQNRDKMKSLGEERKAIMEELKPLAVTYQSTLLSIGAEAKPKMESWKEKGKAIFQEWASAHKDDRKGARGEKGEMGDHPRMGMGGHRGGPGGPGGFGHFFGGMGDGMNLKAMVAHFMLWDGKDFTQDLNQLMGQPGMMGQPFDQGAELK